MSQASKRPGARDISELKARLGLKKSKPARGGGVVPPPGAGIGSIPAPPGAGPPAPQIPDATEDPFGAMNAMAAHAAQTAQPQFVVVNDGQPVANVEGGAAGLRIAKIAGIVLVPLIVGVLVGKISAAANSYNKTIDDAAAIRDDLTKLGKSLVAVQQVMQVAREGTGEFKLNDASLTDELSNIKLEYADPEIAYTAHLQNMSPELVTDLLTVYAETITLYKEIKEHLEKTKVAAKAFAKANKKVKGFNPFNYAAHLQVPTAEEMEQGKTLSFRIVQLGQMICPGDPKPNPNGCGGAAPAGFQYRLDELGGNWGTKALATPDTVANKLVLFDPNTKVMEQVLKGGEASVADVGYTTRIQSIEERLNGLIELRKNVEQRLNNKSNEGKKFSFFM